MKAYKFKDFVTERIETCTIIEKTKHGGFIGERENKEIFRSSLDNGGLWFSSKMDCVFERFQSLIDSEEAAEIAIAAAKNNLRLAKSLRKAIGEKYSEYL